MHENCMFISDVDECAMNIDTCDSNATCTDTDGNFTCACSAGFMGDGQVGNCIGK